jgi:cell division septation protein DedD
MPRLTFFSESPAPEGEEARRGGGGRRKAGDEEPEAAAAPREGAPVEPAAPPARASGAASETLRETLEAEMAAHRDEPAPAPAAGPEAAAEPGTGAERPPAPASGMPVVPGQRVHRDVAAGGTSPAPAAPTAASAATPAPAKAPAPAAKAPAPAPKAPAAAAPAAAPFWIQVYSSGNEPRAREIAASLARRGFGVRVLEAGATFRVRVGPYANRDLAQASAERLRREQKLDTWVTDQP